MNKCHRLGIKNFQTIRQPKQIQLAFDLCTNDPLAPRYVSSKDNNYHHHQKIDTFNNDYFTIKQSTNDCSQKCQYLKISLQFIITILYWIFNVLCMILKYINCLLWCLFKIIRVLTESKRYRSQGLICHSIRCSHHNH